jgi:hypothetical protein
MWFKCNCVVKLKSVLKKVGALNLCRLQMFKICCTTEWEASKDGSLLPVSVSSAYFKSCIVYCLCVFPASLLPHNRKKKYNKVSSGRIVWWSKWHLTKNEIRFCKQKLCLNPLRSWIKTEGTSVKFPVGTRIFLSECLSIFSSSTWTPEDRMQWRYNPICHILFSLVIIIIPTSNAKMESYYLHRIHYYYYHY